MRAYVRQRNLNQRRRFAQGLITTKVQHGTAVCRTMFGCTNPECIEARRKYDKDYHEKNAEKLKTKRRERRRIKREKSVETA